MYDLIFFLGAPGSGKTTVAELLKEKLDSPHIDYDHVRAWHLKRDWSNQSDKERKMSLENLTFILTNYLDHGYKNIIVDGPRSQNLERLAKEFKDKNFVIVTLLVKDPKVLKERVLTETRDSGWRDIEKSIEYNKNHIEKTFPNEIKIDTTRQTPQETTNQILATLKI